MDTWINILKLLGITTTTVLGILGLITVFRDENNRVTKWGQRALIAIIISGMLTIAVHTLESIQKSESQKRELACLAEEIQRQEQTLKGVELALSQLERQRLSLKGADLSLSFEFPVESPLIDHHHKKFRTVYEGLISSYKKNGHAFDSEHPDFHVYGKQDGTIERILLFSSSKDFPKISLSMAVALYPGNIDISNYNFQSSAIAPLLNFALFSGRAEEARLTYFPQNGTYHFQFSEPPDIKEGTGKITSLKDIPGNILAVGVLDYIPDGGITLKKLTLKEISFSHPLGIKLAVSNTEMTGTGNEWPDFTFYGRVSSHGHEPPNKANAADAKSRAAD